ncbi:MAG: formate dehydrogenase accessory protein FdhE [Anaerolineae bacterium]|nr:formate dehydrogenase accessory protein FdhE [Anaerolineae bacterium]
MSGAGPCRSDARWQASAIWGGDASTLERLAEAARERPDLGQVMPFWLAIYQVQVAARRQLASERPPLAWQVRQERLEKGERQLDFEDLQVTAGPLEALVHRLEEAWRRFDPARPPARARWLARARSCFADATLTFGQRRDLAPADALAALALVPYLEWAAAAVAPALCEQSPEWGHGWCPVCGGLPDLAILLGEPAERSLVCSRCSSAWPFRRVGCPFCLDTEQQAYHEGEDARYRLYLCGACRRYLKTVDARRTGGVDPRVERLITIGMDLAALEAGYGPPPAGA